MLFTIGDNPSTSSGKASQITSYQHNHALQRISKTINKQSIQYFWHGGLLDAESKLDSQGNPQITKRYWRAFFLSNIWS